MARNTNHKKLNLSTLSGIFASEDKAREFMEEKRWPSGPVCPHCGCCEVYTLKAQPKSKRPVRKGVYKCSACQKQFTVTVGTVFEDSHVPLRKWLMIVHLMCSSKKGVSAKQIEREVGVTYKTAWFCCHRIREAMKSGPMAAMLGGQGKNVEIDETYVGGVEKGAGRIGRATKKTPVQVMVERGGAVIATPVKEVTSKELNKNISKHIDRASHLVTDGLSSYRFIGWGFNGHSVVDHSDYYVHPETEQHINTAESFNALLKRGHYGIFHSMSKKHLHRYCDEFSFRWNHRKVTDGERMISALERIAGKRLEYSRLIGR